MTPLRTPVPASATIASMQALLEKQRAAHLENGPLDAEQRIDWLNRLIDMLVTHRDDVWRAISRDFGNRTRELSLLADVLGTVNGLKHSREHVRQWMEPDPYEPMFPDADARVEHMPLGVVGVMSPWNFPVNLSIGPLASIVAAGNRCIIKPSELAPASAELIATMVASAFDESEIAVVLGGADVAAEFSRLPFDHLLYTGSTQVGRQVMRAAAENLVPVTLELGGKCPVLVSDSARIDDAAARTLTVKLLNAGQACLAPDYVLVPRRRLDDFITAAVSSVGVMYPSLLTNADYTAIINERHYRRLKSYLNEARADGTQLVEINPAGEDLEGAFDARRIAPTLLIQPPPDARIMHEEIFGPLLPVLTYESMDEAIRFINDRPRPLGLYYFGQDKEEERKVVSRTASGGVTINDVMTHAFMDAMPFGGVGASGMGAYRGKNGFLNFSHSRSVYRQSKAVEAEYALRPPYGQPMQDFLATAINAT